MAPARPRWASEVTSRTPVRPRAVRSRKNPSHPAPSSPEVTCRPRISRCPSPFTPAIPGLTAVGAAAILAETGDPRRYDSSSSLVRHARLSPADNASGAFSGQAHISRRGRPGLRLTVWRAVRAVLIHNPVMAARYQVMTQAPGTAASAPADAGSRQVSVAAAAARARRAKARVACAASLLRWIYSIVVHDTSWDPAVAWIFSSARLPEDASYRPMPADDGAPPGSRVPREMPRQQVEFGRRVTRLRIQVPVDAAHRDHRREHETDLVLSEDPWLPYRPPRAASIAQLFATDH